MVDVKWLEPYELDEPNKANCDKKAEPNHKKDVQTASPFE
jgi:hypothetical protein